MVGVKVPRQRKTTVERAKQYLKAGGITRDDSDDELGVVDHPWEWVLRDAGPAELAFDEQNGKPDTKSPGQKKIKGIAGSRIVGARMGNYTCRIGDTVLLKADGNEAWVGIICDLLEDEDGEKLANFMWFSTPREIRNKQKRRADALENELYITPSWDENPLTTINGSAIVVSEQEFMRRHPTGKVSRSSKDHGKIFVCRRGCNTRTATYTDEFVWEDIFQGAKDIDQLIARVKSQTRATRKRSQHAKDDLEDFVVDASNDGDEPKTPRKRRKLDADSATSTPTKSRLTPKKLLTPSHRRVVVKKPLEFTPLGTRVLPPSALSSPHQFARSNLHVAAVPAALPCREEEFTEVYTVLERAITDGTGSCIYIAGTPGTGKTATVREVVAQLNASVAQEELDDFIFVEINGMKVTDAHQAYSLLWEAIRGDRVSPSHALDLLNREFGAPSPRRVPVVVLMDELDQLVTKTQSVMYNFFNWPSLRHSRLIVLAVANTMDLPERTLSNKISSRLGLQRITFKGYTHHQLVKIIQARLENVPGRVVREDAVLFAAHKVAAVSGDARRALDICRRAVEIAEADALAQVAEVDGEEESDGDVVGPGTPSKTNRRKSDSHAIQQKSKVASGAGTLGSAPRGIVTIDVVRRAIVEATHSPLQHYLRALPLPSKLFLAALLARMRRTGLAEAVLGDVVDEATKLAAVSDLPDLKNGTLRTAVLDAEALIAGGGWGAVGGAEKRGRKRVVAVGHAGTGGGRGAGAGAGEATGEDVTRSRPGIRDLVAMKRAADDANMGQTARALGLTGAAAGLLDAGVIGMEARRGARVGRVRLNIGDEEVKLALKDDESVRGLGFTA